MKRDDHVFAMTTGFVTMPEAKLNNAFAHFADRYEFDILKKSGTISVGGSTIEGLPVGFKEWITSIRQHGVKGIRLMRIPRSENDKLSIETVAAFGQQELALEIISSDGSTVFTLCFMSSPRFEITAEQFIGLIDAQEQNEKLWQRIADMISESNEMNNRPSFQERQIKNYLLTEASAQVLDLLLSQIIQEIQIECSLNNIPFRIPIALKHLFYQTNFAIEESFREPVFLYPVKDISSCALTQLIEAQPFKNEVFQACTTELTENPQQDIPPASVKNWANTIDTLNPSTLASLTHIVCRVICNICEEKNIKPVIPDELSNSFGPDELDSKRAQIRSRMSKDQWYPESYKNPWQLYFFEKLQGIPVPLHMNGVSPKKAFQETLEKIIVFAQSIESPFEQAFLIAQFFLSEKFPKGKYDQRHFKNIMNTLKRRNFSDVALKNVEHTLSYSKDWIVFGWPPEKINALLAISIADVFGGMGSWNDTYIGNDFENFQRITTETYEALRNFLAATLH